MRLRKDERMDNTQSPAAGSALPLERSYLSLQDAFEQAIALEVLLAQQKEKDDALATNVNALRGPDRC
jgi:hypothetical protein